jgi:phenylacetate-CoA ligase
VQEDAMVLQPEPLSSDAQGPATPIITDLWHRTLPIIRYRLGDVVTLSPDTCACGSSFQVLQQVEGRSDDVCEFSATDGTLRRVFPATIRRLVLLASDAIADYAAEQHRPSHLRVRVAVQPGADGARVREEVKTGIITGLAEQGIVSPVVEVEEGLNATPRAQGKRRRVRRVH